MHQGHALDIIVTGSYGRSEQQLEPPSHLTDGASHLVVDGGWLQVVHERLQLLEQLDARRPIRRGEQLHQAGHHPPLVLLLRQQAAQLPPHHRHKVTSAQSAVFYRHHRHVQLRGYYMHTDTGQSAVVTCPTLVKKPALCNGIGSGLKTGIHEGSSKGSSHRRTLAGALWDRSLRSATLAIFLTPRLALVGTIRSLLLLYRRSPTAGNWHAFKQ